MHGYGKALCCFCLIKKKQKVRRGLRPDQRLQMYRLVLPTHEVNVLERLRETRSARGQKSYDSSAFIFGYPRVLVRVQSHQRLGDPTGYHRKVRNLQVYTASSIGFKSKVFSCGMLLPYPLTVCLLPQCLRVVYVYRPFQKCKPTWVALPN